MAIVAHEMAQTDHELAAYEELLIQLEASKVKVSLTGSPVSTTKAVWGSNGMEYQTVPFYTLLDDERTPITLEAVRVVGHEYRFTGLEVDIEGSTIGSYLSFSAQEVIPTIQILE